MRRWRLPITSTLLVGLGGLVAIAVATVMLISIRVAQENTDQLLQQTATNVTSGTSIYRVVSNSTPNWTGASYNRGWYMDFPTTSLYKRAISSPWILG